MQTLHQAGIAYRIVPGITAALGATAYAGIPLTHRDCAQSALFVTGHSKHEGSQPDWQTLALSRQTLVIYMGTLKSDRDCGKTDGLWQTAFYTRCRDFQWDFTESAPCGQAV